MSRIIVFGLVTAILAGGTAVINAVMRRSNLIKYLEGIE